MKRLIGPLAALIVLLAGLDSGYVARNVKQARLKRGAWLRAGS